MKIHLIAVHCDSKGDIIGFRLFDSEATGGKTVVMDQEYANVEALVKSNKVNIVGIEYSRGKLKGSNGSFERYPALCNNKVTRQAIVIIGAIDDVGYRVCNYEGKSTDETVQKLVSYSNNVPIANGKLVTRTDGKQFISAISGNYDNIPVSKSTLSKQEQPTKVENEQKQVNPEPVKNNSNVEDKKAEARKQLAKQAQLRGNDPRFPDVITGIKLKESHLKDIDPDTGMTLEQKLLAAILAVRETKPLYYAILSILKREEVPEDHRVQTAAVSINTLYINPKLIKECTIPQLTFVLLHEVCHIAMKHRIRENHREHDAWNIACDFYVNKSLAEEFNVKELDTDTYASDKKSGQGAHNINIPSWVCYSDDVDVKEDTPEKIYEELMKMQKAMQKQSGGEGEGDSSSDDNEEGQGSGGNGSSSSNSNNQDQGDDQSQGNNQGNNKGKNGNQKSKDGNSDKDDAGSAGNESKDEKEKKKRRFMGKEFRGSTIKEDQPDLVDDNDSVGKSEEQMAQAAATLVNQAVSIYLQNNSWGGEADGFLERYIQEAIAPKVNWKSVLKRFLTRASQKEYTFAHPDRRFLGRTTSDGRRQVFAGPHKVENGELENIKICIDTSGSISNSDLGAALSQIKDMFKQYKADAECLYWDTSVCAVYPFKDVNELVKCKPMGGGGTDANCIFDYFETNDDYRLHRKQQPSLIIVFTDGCFGEVDKKYSRKYKNTVWVISGGYKDFTPPFGVVAPFKIEVL
jgi:predicted metal-dependent peptidase